MIKKNNFTTSTLIYYQKKHPVALGEAIDHEIDTAVCSVEAKSLCQIWKVETTFSTWELEKKMRNQMARRKR